MSWRLARVPPREDEQNPALGRQQRPWLRAQHSLPSALGDLFPLRQGRAPEWTSWKLLAAVAALGGGVILMLERIPGTPAWDGIYAEDLGVFLPNALLHPWQVLIPYNGYMVLVEQSLGQAASMLPLRDAAAFFAITGALIASASALFIFQASAGHIRSPVLRAVLALAVVLLPVAPLQIIDSGVNAPWYLMMALFWVILWRPPTRAGMILAGVLAFVTVASNALSAVFAPLLLLRIVALPRWREHAVTAGFALGLLAQAPYVFGLVGGAGRRLNVHKLSQPGQSVAFYGHRVVLPSIGWHLSWGLRDAMGVNLATLLVGGVLAVLFGWALITRPRPARLFVLTALVTGFVFTTIATTVTTRAPIHPDSPGGEPGGRYTCLPILLLEAAAIVVVDSWLREARLHGPAARGARTAMRLAAVAVLTAILAVGWIGDYRFAGGRSRNVTVWPTASASWLTACRATPAGTIREKVGTGKHKYRKIPCANVHG